MKLKNMTRAAAALTAAALTLGLAGCGKQEAEAVSSPETATAESSASTEETADPYAYLADFDYSSVFDDNGYLTGVTASDYIAVPDDLGLTLSDEANTVTDADVSDYINENILPNYLTPPLFENTEYYYFTSCPDQFVLFKADGDQDRPNLTVD